MSNLDHLTGKIIGAAIKVHRSLGPGLLESAYQICLAHELGKMEIFVEREVPIPVKYDGIQLDCGFRADLIVEKCVIIECKAKEQIHPIDKSQILSHLRLLNLHVGLLINFHEVLLKQGVHRIVNNYIPAENSSDSQTT